jgi:signal transduction histidine kinase
VSDAIRQLSQHINHVLAHNLYPLYLIVDDHLRLLQHRGRGDRYGLPVLQRGMSLAHELSVLATADPEDQTPQSWQFVSLPGSRVCHLHVLRIADAWGVALLDASAEHAEQQVRQQAAHELLLLRDERERLIGELEQANRLKSDFIARMSHEFRTPLASVIGYSDQLRELRPHDEEVQYHLAAVGRGARYLLNLVENLLDQARIEVDQLTLNPGACDLHEMADDIDLLLRPIAEQKQLSLSWWFDRDVPPRLWLDAVRLKQVLTNLVGNAIKFTGQGGVSVELAWRDGRLHLAVVDTGRGIDEGEAAAIFEPFRQGRDTNRAKGAGLGLAISRSLVQAMGGEIRLDSRKGQGSRFAFSIEATAVRAADGAASLAGKCIVVADDDDDLLELFRLYLGTAGCQVHTAHDAGTAQAAVRRFKPDAVLLDLNLGRDDGAAVAASLRTAGYRNKIVMLSATQTGDQGQEAQPDSADARWNKPLSRVQLLDGLADLVG